MRKLKIVLILFVVLILGYASIKVISSFDSDLGNKITGIITGGVGLLLSRPKVGSGIMIIVIVSIIGYYNREKIERIIEKMRERREKI